MKIFNEEIRTQLIDMIGVLQNEVQIAFFGSESKSRVCKDTENFIREFTELNDKLFLEVFDLDKDKEYANELGVAKVPSIVILDEKKRDFGVRFYGIPAGYEIHSLLASIKEMGGVPGDLPTEIIKRIEDLNKKVHIQVFVTPTCSYCPGAVITGHRLAMLNPNIQADMVEAGSFPDDAARYGVKGVPKIIINEEHEFVGSQPITKFIELIENLG